MFCGQIFFGVDVCIAKVTNSMSLSQYTWNCEKCNYLPYTLQVFFTTATIFQQFFSPTFWEKFLQFCVLCVRALICSFTSFWDWKSACWLKLHDWGWKLCFGVDVSAMLTPKILWLTARPNNDLVFWGFTACICL